MEPGRRDAAGRLLLAYVALLAFIQVLPLDLTASPAEPVPQDSATGECGSCRSVSSSGRATRSAGSYFAKLVKFAGLYLPVGLLAARLKGRIESWSIAPRGARGTGAGRVSGSAATGGAIAHAERDRRGRRRAGGDGRLVRRARIHHEGLALPFAVSWGIVWLAAETSGHATAPRHAATRHAAPVRLDARGCRSKAATRCSRSKRSDEARAVRAVGRARRARGDFRRAPGAPGGSVRVAVAVAAVLGLLDFGVFEAASGGTTRTRPCITDVLLGGLGAALGVLVASRASRAGCAGRIAVSRWSPRAVRRPRRA